MPKMFEDQHGDLKVYEACNGFYITHIPTDTTRGMGDGTTVDGSFMGYCKGMVKGWYNDLMEAYFPEMIPHCDGCNMKYVAAGALKGNVHEKGCVNDGKDWIPGRGWVRFIECRECGDRVEEGEPCICMEADPFDPAEHRYGD